MFKEGKLKTFFETLKATLMALSKLFKASKDSFDFRTFPPQPFIDEIERPMQIMRFS